MQLESRITLPAVLAVLALGAGALAVGCGGDSGEKSSRTAAETSATGARTAEDGLGPIPSALRTAESAAEDTIDYALAGDRDKAVETANALKAAADGPAGEALAAAGVGDAQIADFRARADHVARLAGSAGLLRVALASNRAFGLIPGFFGLYQSQIPAGVTQLDYLDFEAKLRAKAGDGAALRSAVERLGRTWRGLRADLVSAGGSRVALEFDAHVKKMQRLAAGGDRTRAEQEAQHGLDLVDELEAVYAS